MGTYIEVVGFNYRAGGHDGIDNCLHIFGNCLEFEPGTDNANFLFPADNSEDGELFNEKFGDSLNPDAKSFLLKGLEFVSYDQMFTPTTPQQKV